MIEVEVATILTYGEYDRLETFFQKHAIAKGEEDQITHYLEGKVDIRIQQSSDYAKIWMKKGIIHDESREEFEVKTNRESFDKLVEIFTMLGYPISLSWYRKRKNFLWEGITVALDDTKGYAKILELEMLVPPEQQEKTLAKLKKKLAELKLSPTPREEFERRYKHYKQHWKERT